MKRADSTRKSLLLIFGIVTLVCGSSDAFSKGGYYDMQYNGIKYHFYVPNNNSKKLKVLVSIHGTNGDAKHYLNIPIKTGDPEKYGLVVVAPQFPSSKHNSTNI